MVAESSEFHLMLSRAFFPTRNTQLTKQDILNEKRDGANDACVYARNR